MATFKACVQKHQLRRDGRYPVSIRLTHHRRVLYLPTGLYVQKKQTTPRTLEIKDQFVLQRTNATISEYEKVLLSMTQADLLSADVEQLRDLLCSTNRSPDFFAYCEKFLQKKSANTALKNALIVIREDMGYKKMRASDFTSSFLRAFKDVLDRKHASIVIKSRDGVKISHRDRLLSQDTKRNYFNAISAVFRAMKVEYNTEYYQLIRHDPFVGVEPYRKVVSARRYKVVSAETIRRLFAFDDLSATQRRTMEMLKLSFCMCAVNSADIVTMKKECYNPSTNRVTYSRRKTKDSRADKAITSVRIEPEIKDIFEKYRAKDGEYLFDFGTKRDTQIVARKLCAYLSNVCDKMGIEHINPYMLRHSYATIARNDLGISKDDVDLLLNHVGNNPMADAYIAVSWDRNDINNRKILDYVFYGKR